MNEERVTFKSGELTLEGMIALPDGPGPHRAAVVCHPHPLYGGSMHNNVVEAILSALWELDYATLRFNFRGVGQSEGTHNGGPGETEDAVEAVRFITHLPMMSRDGVVLAGYSFGAMVAAQAAVGMPEVFTIAAVAPPVLSEGPSYLARAKKRLVIVAGEHDIYCPLPELEALRASLSCPLRIKAIAGADHFFIEHESEVTSALVDGLAGA